MTDNNKRPVIDSDTIDGIGKLLGNPMLETESGWKINLVSKLKKTEISLEIYPEQDGTALISVYTENAHLQLQECNSIILSEMLSEVIFTAECGDKISGLIVSMQGDCSLYSNVNKKLLSSDLSELTSEKLIAAVALSLTEN